MASENVKTSKTWSYWSLFLSFSLLVFVAVFLMMLVVLIVSGWLILVEGGGLIGLWVWDFGWSQIGLWVWDQVVGVRFVAVDGSYQRRHQYWLWWLMLWCFFFFFFFVGADISCSVCLGKEILELGCGFVWFVMGFEDCECGGLLWIFFLHIRRQYLMWFVELHVYFHRQQQLESTINYINYKHMTNSHKPNS